MKESKRRDFIRAGKVRTKVELTRELYHQVRAKAGHLGMSFDQHLEAVIRAEIEDYRGTAP